MVNSIQVIRWVEILLVLVVAWVLAGIVMQPHILRVPANIAGSDVSNDDNTVALDVAVIRDTALFGVAEIMKELDHKPVKPAPVAAVVTPPLVLKLWGTVVAGDASVAILAVGNKPKQKVFHLHESIENEVTLDMVWADAVEVNDHGRKRRIELRKPTGVKQASPPSGLGMPIPPPTMGGMVQRNISRKMINRQTRNFSTLLSQARVIPHFSNGKADGFVINNIVPRSLFQQIGLRNGDIIRKVNQAVISSASQAMQLYQSLQKASDIQLEVERAGQTQTINYHIQ